jgi:hypothetical protein
VTRIEELGWRSLLVRNLFNELLLIPNSDAVRARIRILGRGRRAVAVRVHLSVAYACPPHLVKDVLLEVAGDLPLLAADREPQILVSEFADSGIVYEARLWTRQPWEVFQLTDLFLTRAHAALARAEMEIPFPQRTLHIRKPPAAGSASAARHRALATCPLFVGLGDELLDELAIRSRLLRFAPDELVVRQGDRSDSLFVIAEGEIAVEIRGNRLSKLAAGEVFGERAMLTGEPRSADVRALSDLQLIEVDREHLARIVEINEDLADELAARMAERDAVTGEPSGAIKREEKLGVVSQIRNHLLRLVGGG